MCSTSGARRPGGAWLWYCVVVIGVAWSTLGVTGRARADAEERFRRLRSPLVLPLSLSATGMYRPDHAGPVGATEGALRLSAPAISFETKGAMLEVLRLGGGYYLDAETVDLNMTLFDLQHMMIGRSAQDGEGGCLPAVFLLLWGDCDRDSGWFGLRLQLLSSQLRADVGRWFHRWVEVGLLADPLGPGFSDAAGRRRLPLLLGVSLDHVAGVPLSDGTRSNVALRGVAGWTGLWRTPDFRWELEMAGRYRPNLLDGFTDDFGLELHARVAHVFLEAVLLSHRPTVQRLVLDVNYAYYKRPELAPRWTHLGQPHLLTATLSLIVNFYQVDAN